MYKYLSIILAIGLAIAVCFYFYQKSSFNELRSNMNNEIAKLQQTVKEKEDLYSMKALEVDNLSAKNRELQKIINSRDEEILSLTEINIRLKNEIFEIRNALQEVLDANGNVVPPDPNCESCLSGKRFKVSFEQEKNYLKVSGFTLTNPPEATIKVEWVKDLILDLYLTKDSSNGFKVYLQSNDSSVEKIQLKLSVDPNILNYKWYEKIAVGGNVVVGEGISSTINIMWQFFPEWVIGPAFTAEYDGIKLRKFVGISTFWFPFR